MKKNLFFIMSLLAVMALTTVNVSAAQYTLTVQNSYISRIGSVAQAATTTTASIEEGTEVRIDANVDTGYYFDHWSSNNNLTFDESILDYYVFTMPSENVTITANNISSSSYEKITSKDFMTNLKGDYSNLDDLVDFNITYYAPTVGTINSSNQGKFKLPDFLTFEKASYLDEEMKLTTTIKHGEKYYAALLFKTSDLKQFENKKFMIKTTGSTLTDMEGGLPGFPNNYIMGVPDTDYEDDEDTGFSVEAREQLAYRYMVLLVQFEGKYNYEVTFDTNGVGTSIESQTVIEDETLVKPADPTAKGYTFGGWYTDKECTKAFDFNSKLTGNITLYAKWTKGTNPKTFDGITTWIIIGTISLITLSLLIINRKKISSK